MFFDFSRAIALFEQAGKRYCVVGDDTAGVLVGLDLEGRLYSVLDGKILNRLSPDAVTGQTTGSEYLNPGGDGLWPAPEGTALGYEYSTGKWRVPPGLTSARYLAKENKPGHAAIHAEVDLVNNRGLGVPTVFSREIEVSGTDSGMQVHCREGIKYMGVRSLAIDDCILAPWSLCQFDSGPGCEVAIGADCSDSIWDLYDSSAEQRYQKDGVYYTKTDGAQRYQVGLDSTVQWIEYRNPDAGLVVRRSAGGLPGGQDYVDIIDAPPDQMPGKRGVRFSVYSDPSCFMEIEAAGGCPEKLESGCEMSVEVITDYSLEH